MAIDPSSRHTSGPVPIRDTELWVERRGAGVPIVAIHGGLGFDHGYLHPWLEPLAALGELATFDLRGQGRSRPLADDAWPRVSMATFVDDLEGLREHLARDAMVVLGHSFGAFIALAHALAHPTRVRALVLVSGAVSMAHGEAIVAGALARDPALGAAFLGALGSPIASDEDFARGFPPFLPLYFAGPVPDGFMADTRFRAAAFAHGHGVLAPSLGLADRLAELRVPTLVMTGARDFIMPVEPCARTLAAGIPGARLAVVEHAGHFPFAERPDVVLDALRAFLAPHLAAGRA